MAQGPLCGDARSSHSISVEVKMVTPKIDVWDSASVSHPRAMSLQFLE